MIGYSDGTLMEVSRDKRGGGGGGAGVQLTPLWEHVVRTRSVPRDANLADIFAALGERLRDPEWEVRQHALRVLVDVIPVLDGSLDQRMEALLGDLVSNLGHPGPAVRKGALDSLKVYLRHSAHADNILRNIVYRGVDNCSENQLQSDVVVGIILALPSLIVPGRTADATVEYIVRCLVGKLVQVTYQEVSLRSLARIRDMTGAAAFERVLEDTQPDTRRDFELLCQVYEAHGATTTVRDSEGAKWNDLNANVVHDSRWQSDSDEAERPPPPPPQPQPQPQATVDEENNVPAGKVILETEIQFNSSTAVTMKILEERSGGQEIEESEDEDEDSRDCVVQVLSDSDAGFEVRRRTPRRVRFGGEIVKLRTPDSDSNHPSDTDTDMAITTSPGGGAAAGGDPVIEIKFVTGGKEPSGAGPAAARSLIPVAVSPARRRPRARSLPPSPSSGRRDASPSPTAPTRTKLLYQSHPNLTRAHFFSDKQNKINTKLKPLSSGKLKIQIPKKQASYVDNATSPIPVHHHIELFHNLTRSPTHEKPQPPFPPPKPPEQHRVKETAKQKLTNRKASTADSVLLETKPKPKEERTVSTADAMKQPRQAQSASNVPSAPAEERRREQGSMSNAETSFTTDMSDSESNPGRTFNSFILKDSGSEGVPSDSCIPNLDSGECLTCSSSGSEGLQADGAWEAVAQLLGKDIVADMHDKEDWRTRLRGLEAFSEAVRRPQVLRALGGHVGPLLQLLLSAERQPRLQARAEAALHAVLEGAPAEALRPHLAQLAAGLSRMGAPAGVRLATLAMRRLGARALVRHALDDPVLAARSAKTREGGLQVTLCAATLFPSSEVDAVEWAGRVALAASDRRRRVRQAALDTLAALATLAGAGAVLAAARAAGRGGEPLLAAVRARLARRQLPRVQPDGSVLYAALAAAPAADVDWVAAGSGSMSPCSARSRRRTMPPPSATINRLDSATAMAARGGMWSARRYAQPADAFGQPVHHHEPADAVTWALVPVGDGGGAAAGADATQELDSQSQAFPAAQLWALEQPGAPGDLRLNGSSGGLRPVYLLQAQPPSPGMRLVAGGEAAGRPRGRSSSPPPPQARLAQLRTRGQSSSPPGPGSGDSGNARDRRFFTPNINNNNNNNNDNAISSDDSTHSKGSPPRNNWQREFQSAIPVPVSGEGGRSRFRRRLRERESPPGHPLQPMVAVHHHQFLPRTHPHQLQQAVASAPVIHPRYRRSKSPSPTRFSVAQLSQDSGIPQRSSSGSDSSSDYYTPPAEPYLPAPPQRPHSRGATPPPAAPNALERFINLEDSASTSDFDEPDERGHSDDSQDLVRSQVYHKLQEEHVAGAATRIPPTPSPHRHRDGRLSKSHADLSQVKNLSRKAISSAPPVKLPHGQHPHAEHNNNNHNDTVDEESKASLNSSNIDLKSVGNQSQADLHSVNSQLELRSLNQSQADLRNSNASSSVDVKSLSQSQGEPDVQSIESVPAAAEEPEATETPEVVKCPEIVKKKTATGRTLKRRGSTRGPAAREEGAGAADGPVARPREALAEAVALLESPEWEASVRGLQALGRLERHHAATVEAQLHAVCVLLGRHIRNLRSQVSRAACHATADMFRTHRKALEPELEELAVPLLQRTADTNKFLRADANAALDAMCANVGAARAVAMLATRGASHHNAVVRCATARLLADLVRRLGAARVFQLPRDTRDRILLIGANMLTEGNLDTRKYTKSMFGELSGHPQFQRALSEAVPVTTLRHIGKAVSSLK